MFRFPSERQEGSKVLDSNWGEKNSWFQSSRSLSEGQEKKKKNEGFKNPDPKWRARKRTKKKKNLKMTKEKLSFRGSGS